ncbi:MAG: YtxH domain-containing protein [Paludibacteraceae bacterium]|nr:YtxH domain-containing protein [Paludibacteraceae bacterium]
MKTENFIALIGGLAAGIAIGFLFAPDKGSETRQKIVDNLRKRGIYMDRERLDEFVNKVKTRFLNGKRTIEEAIDDIVSEEHLA